MAKTKYNPNAFHEDPLAALKQATGDRATAETADLSTVAASDQAEIGVTPGSSSAPIKPLATTLKPSRNTMYLYPEDLTKLRQLSGYAAIEHGIRANDSMIVRAALSLLEADVRFFHALKDAELSDRRRVRG